MIGKALLLKRAGAWTVLALVAAAGALAGISAEVYRERSEPSSARAVPVYMAAYAETPAAGLPIDTGFSAVVQRVLPAVVNISSTKLVKTAAGSELSPLFSDPFFRQFFGDDLPQPNIPQDRRQHSLGSGVIISPEGYVLTNNHVVEGASEIKVTLADKRELAARLAGRDPGTDIALLKVDAKGLPVLALGDSTRVRAGDVVLAVGSPFGLGQTVTMGIVSATGRAGLDIEDYENFIQTDAAINPGNSGGALVDTQGELIGINTAILSGGGGNQGIGFAVPVNMARDVMSQLMKQGRVIRGYLGATIQQVTPGMARAFGLKQAGGALVSEVIPGSAAARAGLSPGDIIVAMDHKPVSDMRELRFSISMIKPGTTVDLTVFRDGREREVRATLAELPQRTESGGRQEEHAGSALEGVSVDELTPEVARQLGLPAGTKGVVVAEVSDSSRAADTGLRRGDVIQQVNRQPVSSISDFERLVRAGGVQQPILLFVNRAGHTVFMLVEP